MATFPTSFEEQGYYEDSKTGELKYMTRFTSFDPPMRSSLESQYVSKKTLMRDIPSEKYFKYLLYRFKEEAAVSKNSKPKSLARRIKNYFKGNTSKER